LFPPTFAYGQGSGTPEGRFNGRAKLRFVTPASILLVKTKLDRIYPQEKTSNKTNLSLQLMLHCDEQFATKPHLGHKAGQLTPRLAQSCTGQTSASKPDPEGHSLWSVLSGDLRVLAE
jgi:hypothetical protein